MKPIPVLISPGYQLSVYGDFVYNKVYLFNVLTGWKPVKQVTGDFRDNSAIKLTSCHRNHGKPVIKLGHSSISTEKIAFKANPVTFVFPCKISKLTLLYNL